MLLTVLGTPAWANGGKGAQKAPMSAVDLRRFAYAAARRYSGTFLDVASGRVLPRVGLWLAWNEPNNPVFLQPQYTRVNRKWRMASPAAYAHICEAVYAGVHAAGGPEQVACGGTAPRGSNDPTGTRPSIAPLAFMRAAKRMGLRHFDAWAHHPVLRQPARDADDPEDRAARDRARQHQPADLPADPTLRPKPVWLTEYGYQTNPPDKLFGVSWQKQADYLRQAYEIAKANPRIELLIWFLLRDSPSLDSWQSGLMTVDGRKKPAFAAFARLLRSSL